ncbi:NYN domain-containing protein [Pseudoruegeria sp. SHC-113]|uniref:NYN domain-containing protein n=1 Tax=Pseudoruegeria sp. SHC-113 TaxID=2855439 RepID=UPI0021BA6283|nr:NYN domain-containing protein [Pseudoruegeria sp. SHC-113]MCT8158536.1 NYN domain-containing protein [Pseudoruegeria sp. SHC-113]
MRVRVYVDGFNFYYRRLRSSNYKWVNLRLLSQELVQSDDVVEGIRYFTADVSSRSGDPDAPTRQATYFRALKTIPELSIHKGKFLPKKITRPLVSDPATFVTVHDTEEKGSDVNLASYLLMDAFCDSYDLALIFSQDTDLLEPIRMVKQELGKKIVVAWLDGGAPSKRLRSFADSVRHVSDGMLQRSQFPETVRGRGGSRIVKPNSW